MTQMVRDHRVDYAAPVQLLLPDLGQAVPGYTANISESGIFITVSRPFAVGDEVVCDLPLVGDRLSVRGEVIWVQEVPTGDDEALTGMGVRFVGLSAGDLEALKRVVISQRGQPQSVVVHFQGYARPIRASALVTDNGLQLWTALPFLRLQSPVNVAFAGQEDEDDEVAHQRAQQGVLNQVDLDLAQGVPRLQIQVGLDRRGDLDVDPSGPEEGPWRPGQVIFTAPEYAVDASVPAVEQAPPVEQALPVEQAPPAYEAEQDDDDVPIVDAGLASGEVVTGVIEQPAVGPEADVPDTWGAASVETCDVACPPATGDPSAESHWSLGQPHAADDTPYDRFWSEAERRRHRIWLWIVAVVMAGIAMASMVQTEFWNQVKDRLWAQPESGPQVTALPGSLPDYAPAAAAAALAAPEPDSAPVPVAKPVAKPEPSRGVAPVSKARPSEAARASSSPSPAKAKGKAAPVPKRQRVGRFAIERGTEGVSLTIPLRGSIDEARHYLLAEPAGVAINLPHGRPNLPFGHYAVNQEGFRAVWVRSREGGSQVRVFFGTKPASRPTVAVDDGQIRVQLTP